MTEDKNTENETRLLALIWTLAAELHVGRSLPSPSLKCSLERELGFDSLTRAELLSRVEQAFSVRLPGKAFVQIDTPAELLQLIDTSVHPGKASTQPFETGESVLSETATASLPTGAQTLPEVLAWHVAQHGERIHVHLYEEEDQPVPVSYQALFDGAAAIASGLRARRVSPGQSIAIMLPTSRDYLFSFFGILLAGAIPVPIYPGGTCCLDHGRAIDSTWPYGRHSPVAIHFRQYRHPQGRDVEPQQPVSEYPCDGRGRGSKTGRLFRQLATALS